MYARALPNFWRQIFNIQAALVFYNIIAYTIGDF